VEPVTTMDAPSFNSGSAFWTVKTVPRTLLLNVWSNSSGVSCSRVAKVPPPALATTMSSLFAAVLIVV